MKLICFNRRQHLYKCDHPHVALSVRIDRHETWILALRVDEGWRRKGLATEMVDEVIACSGFWPVYLYPVADSPDKQVELEQWYIRMGFRYAKHEHGQLLLVYL